MYETIEFIGPDRRLDHEILLPPAAADYRLVVAHWTEFRAAIEEIDCRYWSDEILFSRYARYYQKVAKLLHPEIPVDSLLPSSRHSLYVSKGVVVAGDERRVRLAGIHSLLGYKEQAPAPPGSSGLDAPQGTGRDDLDVIASLVQLGTAHLEWLCANFSLAELALIAEYLWEMKAAAAGQVTEAQRRRDIAYYEQVRAQQPDLDRAADESVGWLLHRTGKQAIEIARMQNEQNNG